MTTEVVRGTRGRARVPEGWRIAEPESGIVASRSVDFGQPLVVDDPLDPGADEIGRALRAEVPLRDELVLEPTGETVEDEPFEYLVENAEVAALVADEHGGLRWVLPEERDGEHAIRIDLPDPGAGGRRGLGDWIAKKVKAWVFDLVVETVVDGAVTLAAEAVEGRIEEGLVHVPHILTHQWDRADRFPLPDDRRPRVLLLIHGTFSSTIGSFGGLSAAAAGAFIEAALGSYDVVLGFDHRTLTKTPEDNARDLLAALEERAWPKPPRLDIVAFSRGGMVARFLVEHLLPASEFDAWVDRVVFLASPNGGTALAEEDNWDDLLSLVTNLTAAVCRLLSLAPSTAAAAATAQGVVSGIADLVKLIARSATNDASVPGLAAMRPGSAQLQKLNGAERPALPRPPAYVTITSDFEVDLVDDSRGLPKRVAMSLFDQVADRMFHRTRNDLVVANDSTLSFHTAGPMADEASSLRLEKNGRVHHMCFMVAEEVVEHLMTCLPTQSRPEGFLGHGTRSTPSLASVVEIEAKAPDEVSLGKDCDVSVIVRGTPLGSGTQAGVDPSLPLRVEAIVSQGFDSLEEAVCVQEIAVPERDKESVAEFSLRASEVGQGEVFLRVFQGERLVLGFTMRVTIVAADEIQQSGLQTERHRVDPHAGRASHLLLVTLGGPRDDRFLDYRLISETVGSHRFARHPLDGPLEEPVARLFKDLEARWEQSNNARDFDSRLEDLGWTYADRLLPQALRELLWDRRGDLAGLQVLSDEGYVPWELLRLNPDNGDGIFLAELGLVRSRWDAQLPASLRLRPRSARTVVPRYPVARLQLPYAIKEEQYLRMLLGARSLPAESRSLLEELRQGDAIDLLHFAGHGVVDDSDAWLVLNGAVRDDGGQALWHPDRLESTRVESRARMGDGDRRPLVFLNACQTGRGQSFFAGDKGWARAFLRLERCGAGAFVAPLWSVADGGALSFAQFFYEALLNDGKTFSEAALIARRSARQAGDPTWLAYTVYASPEARLIAEAR